VPVMARNGRETCISRLAPYVAARNDGEGMLLALILAHQHGTGLEAPWAIHSRLVAAGEIVKELCSLCIKSTNGLLLDVPADEPRREVFGEGQRWGRPERRAHARFAGAAKPDRDAHRRSRSQGRCSGGGPSRGKESSDV